MTIASDPFANTGSPWSWHNESGRWSASHSCNICWWYGERFEGFYHSESALCPHCGSIARDRFLFYCFVHCTPERRYRVLETSPRLGASYRSAMKEWFDYKASDFDQRAHRADLQVDLQAIDLEDESIDIVLTPHVLEHVPDTERALRELHRILAPGGKLFLQVPVLQGWTTPPPVPEFHGDDTPVFWRFGLDLSQRIRDCGFRTRLLCLEGFADQVRLGATRWPDPAAGEFDVPSILAGASVGDLAPVTDFVTAHRLGLQPAFMFLTWEAEKAVQAKP